VCCLTLVERIRQRFTPGRHNSQRPRILVRFRRRSKAKRRFLQASSNQIRYRTYNRPGLVFQMRVHYSDAALRIHHQEIVPIILAAGSSKHLDFPKAVAKFGSKTALQLALENCEGLGRAIVVLGSDARKIRPAVPKGVCVVLNRRWREGQMSSLRCALRHIPASAPFMIYPVDHCLLRRRTVQALVRAFQSREGSKQIVTPQHQGRLGHPIIVGSAMRREFFTEGTARDIVYRDPGRNLVIPMQTSTIYEDFDTTETYRRCLRKFFAARRVRRKAG
jgi:molybdenum cofactor cytidylyltransferase